MCTIVSPVSLTSIYPLNIVASSNDDVMLECSTDAGPNTRILWLFNASERVCVASLDCEPDVFNLTDGK